MLFAIIMLFLTLILLPTASVVAPGPKPKEQANVAVTGEISTIGAVTLDMRRAGRLVIVYGPASMDTDLSGDLWEDFGIGHELGIRIDKGTVEAEIIYRFGTSDFEGKEWSRYQLTGLGTWSGESIPYGTVTVTGETFTVYEMIYERTSKKNGKGAIGVTYDEVWSGSLTFTIKIDPV